MKKTILIRYSEIHLKKRNRHLFLNQLKNIINSKIDKFGVKAVFQSKRFVVDITSKQQQANVESELKKIFGINSFSVAEVIETSHNAIVEKIKNYKISDTSKSFAIKVNRADKSFNIKSPDLEKELGHEMLKKYPELTVDLKNPDERISFDIRENNKTYIYNSIIKTLDGMPVGSAGTALGMLSGGIDSPVAAFKIASRGARVNFVHFHMQPYTSEESRSKVITLAKKLKEYTLAKKLYMVSITNIQENIAKFLPSEYSITSMRRVMMRISEKICQKEKYNAIVTGENLAQVASQTMESIATIEAVLTKNIPVLRPLIAYNKEEITLVARKIGTYTTSILPYDDCCTLFVPSNPSIKPDPDTLKTHEIKLESLDKDIDKAISEMEVIEL